MSDVNLRETALRYGGAGVVPGIVGITDVGIETAAASARIGASTGQPE
jgi:hypothetical protein